MPNPQLSAVPAVSVKRKNAPRDDEDDDDDSSSDVSMINVDFDFYNLNPDVDQIAIKRLLRQNLSHDDHLVDVHPLADLILSEAVRLGAGSAIKTDGTESDPWGLVAAVDLRQCQGEPGLKSLVDYLSTTTPPSVLRDALDPSSSTRPALIFSLRMLNLPLPLMPPLYKMLVAELAPVDFTHYIVWGRGYRLEGSEERMGLEMDLDRPGNKKKKGGAATEPHAAGSFPYHPEEEFIDARAVAVHAYPLKTSPPRDDESFGVEQFGRLVLLERAKLADAVEAMEEACR